MTLARFAKPSRSRSRSWSRRVADTAKVAMTATNVVLNIIRLWITWRD